MKQYPRPSPLRIALLALGLLAGATLQAPAHAAAGLGQFTRGVLAPADITGGVIFGKNGEVIPLDARGKPLKPCVMSRAGSRPPRQRKRPCRSASAVTTPKRRTKTSPGAAASHAPASTSFMWEATPSKSGTPPAARRRKPAPIMVGV